MNLVQFRKAEKIKKKKEFWVLSGLHLGISYRILHSKLWWTQNGNSALFWCFQKLQTTLHGLFQIMRHCIVQDRKEIRRFSHNGRSHDYLNMIQNVSMEVLSCRKEKLHFEYELKFQDIVPLFICLFILGWQGFSG
jgi:hypothetical protein